MTAREEAIVVLARALERRLGVGQCCEAFASRPLPFEREGQDERKRHYLTCFKPMMKVKDAGCVVGACEHGVRERAGKVHGARLRDVLRHLVRRRTDGAGRNARERIVIVHDEGVDIRVIRGRDLALVFVV